MSPRDATDHTGNTDHLQVDLEVVSRKLTPGAHNLEMMSSKLSYEIKIKHPTSQTNQPSS